MKEFVIKENELRDLQLIEVVHKNTGLTRGEAAEIVKYNVLTISQLARITNHSVSAIQNMMRPLKSGVEPKLKQIFPFKHKEINGPAFIIFDEFCYEYIISSYKPKL